jgi:hypothetical protein
VVLRTRCVGDDRAATRVGAQVGFDAAVFAACSTRLDVAS